MADTLSQPLAEALVKVKLVYDKTEIKSQTAAIVDKAQAKVNKDDAINLEKAHKQRMALLKKESRALTFVGKEFSHIGNMLIAGGLMGKALGGLGVAKYLKTTEVGAEQLKGSIDELKKSYDQFLARVGKVIVKSGVLEKSMAMLKKFLDSLNEKKIEAILNYAKWMLIYGVIFKITGLLIGWSGHILKLIGHLDVLARSNIFKKTVVSAGANTAGNVAGGVAGGLTAGVVVSLKSAFNWFKDLRAMSKMGEELFEHTSWMTKFKHLFQDIIEVFRTLFPGLARFSKLFPILGKIAGWFALLLIPLDALLNVINRHKDAGDKLTKLGVLWDVTTLPIRKLWQTIMVIGNVIEFFTNTLTEAFEAFFTLFDPSKWEQLFTDWTATWEEWWKDFKNNIKKLFGFKVGEEKNDKFKWKAEKIGSTSFEGLVKMAQDFVTDENTRVLKDNTAELRKLNEALRRKQQSPRANPTPYAMPSDMTIPGNIPFMII